MMQHQVNLSKKNNQFVTPNNTVVNSAIQLQDNRLQSIIKKEQITYLSNNNSSKNTIQKKNKDNQLTKNSENALLLKKNAYTNDINKDFAIKNDTSIQNKKKVVQRVGIVAAIATIGTYLAWGTPLIATPIGLLAAYLVYRQASESIRYRMGLKENERKKIEKIDCQVKVLRSQRYNHKMDSYQDDHISIAVIVNGEMAKSVGFWLDKKDYKDFTALAIYNKGEVRDDNKKFEKADSSADITINITPEQASKIIQEIERDEKNPPKFSTTGYGGYTCVTWADKVLRSNGITLKMTNQILPPSPEHIISDENMKKDK